MHANKTGSVIGGATSLMRTTRKAGNMHETGIQKRSVAVAMNEKPEKMVIKNESASSSRPPRSNLSILVVDDNEDAAELLSAVLERRGHRVVVAHNGRRALDEARRVGPDVAIVDIGLPGMDGYEFVAELCDDETIPSCRLIALTGNGEITDHRRSAEAGFEEHLVKPVDLRLLVEVVEAG